MTSATDFAFATELFILVFGLFCCLSSSRQQKIQILPARSIRYSDALDEQKNLTVVMPVSKPQPMPVLPDPWGSEEWMIERNNSVSSTSNVAPMRFQLCLPPAKKDVELEAMFYYVRSKLTVERAKQILMAFAERYHHVKPKIRTKKAELIHQIETYLLDFNCRMPMQEIICNAIGGKL